MVKLKTILSSAMVLGALFAPAAVAQTSTPQQDGYNSVAGQVQSSLQEPGNEGPSGTSARNAPLGVSAAPSDPSGSQPGSPTTVAASSPADASNAASGDGGNGSRSEGTLPFTGLSIGLIIAAGLGLLVLGAGLRRATRSSATP